MSENISQPEQAIQSDIIHETGSIESQNSGLSSIPITIAIVAINVLVFIAMLISGVSIFAPTGLDILTWGGNYSPVTFAGDWWRLLSCIFVHIGIVHLALNMYALFFIGAYLEPMLGKSRFITAYLCTGVFASMASLWWHSEPVVSAGASGAVFGLYGVFLALLTTNLIPRHQRMPLLQSIGIFIGYNLLQGLRAEVDNAAHVGGLISGMAIGYVFYFQLREWGQLNSSWIKNLAPTMLATTAAAFFYLNSNKVIIEKDDSETFYKSVEHFSILEEIAIESMQAVDSVPKEEFVKTLKGTALKDWVECVNLMDESEKLNLQPQLKELREDLLQYAKHRVEETLLYIKANDENTNQYNKSIDSVQQQINIVVEKIKESRPKEKPGSTQDL